MIKINCIIFIFICVFPVLSQNKVCENSDNKIEDLNLIGKCAIEEFKKSNKTEYLKVQTRNRYVRKKTNSYLSKLKKNLNHSKTNEVTKTSESNNFEKPKTSNVSADKKIDEVVSASSESILKDFIRFDQVNEIPVFINCADASIAFKNSCVKETFVNIILDNFTYPFDAAAAGLEGTVWVRFIIDKEGYVKNVSTKGPENGSLLEEEAKRLVSLLPKFIPGKHKNNFVNVEYFMPIDFHLNK